MSTEVEVEALTDLLALVSVRRMVADGTARAVRVNAGLSLREVADAVGVHFTTIQYWEQGRSRPRKGAAIRYARLLDELLKQ